MADIDVQIIPESTVTVEVANDIIVTNPFTLPTATANILGGIKVGENLSITDGVLSASGGASFASLSDETDINDSDSVPFYDASAMQAKKSLFSNIKSKLKTYFDTLYAVLNHTHSSADITDLSIPRNADFTLAGLSEKSYESLTDKPQIPSGYILPTATANTLGGVKVGGGLSISDGVLSAKPSQVSSGTTITLADNTEYRLTGVTALTLSYPTGGFECWLRLSFASSGTISVTLPTSTYVGTAPSFANGETWEISIKDSIVIAQKVGDGT